MTEHSDITALHDALREALIGEPWRAEANCRGLDPDLFYPGRGAPVQHVREICAACQVRTQCEQAGMKEKFGIWGGYSERERRRVLRKRTA